MKTYNICNVADEMLFYKQCKALEKNIPNLIKSDLLEDVDGSLTQIYTLNNNDIIVHNSLYVDALYIETDVEIAKYFNK